MTVDNDDLEDFIRLQKEKLARERHGASDPDRTPRKQWDRSNQEQIKHSVKEIIPVRSDTPEVPLAARLGQHEETRKRLAEEKRREYNELVSRQGGGRHKNRKVSADGGAVLPGLRDSHSAKQRKIAERNREYNEFLKSQPGKGRRAKPQNEQGNEGLVLPSERPKPRRSRDIPVASPPGNRATFVGPFSRSRDTSPNEFRNQVPRLDLGHSAVGRELDLLNDHRAPPQNEGGNSLPIDDRADEQRRKEEERNREYNNFLKTQGIKRGPRREPSPSETDPRRHQRARSVGAPQIEEPRKGWATPRYDDILETKRHQELSYRQGAGFSIRPAVSDSDLDQIEGSRKLDRLDDMLESRKVRFKSELYGGGPRRPRVALDDDDWLDFYKSPSRYDRDFDGLTRAHTTLDSGTFQSRADRVKSAPLREQGFPTRSTGAVTTSRDQYRLELEQQMKMNAENRRREKLDGLAVNATGLTDITRQSLEMEYNQRGDPRRTDAPGPAPSLLQPGGNKLSAAGGATLGPYNSPVDEAYYYYSQRDPLDLGLELAQPSGYIPSVPGTSTQYGSRRQVEVEPKSRVTFGPAPSSFTPRHKNESDLVTVAAIPTLTEEDQKGIARQKSNNYHAELLRQIEENRQRKNMEEKIRKLQEAKLEAEVANYNPFGKGGGGAPLKDTQGNVYADLKQMHKHNVDPTLSRFPWSADLPVTTSVDIHKSVYDTYVSPRQAQPQTYRKTNAYEEPTFARGGHGIFGEPKTDAEKSAADKYKYELQRQIAEKRIREEERKALQKAEEERELKKIEEARIKMQLEYEEELRKQRDKEENVRHRNEELKLQAEEKRREADRLRREADDRRNRVPSRTVEELDRERARLTISPPIPTLRTKDDFSPRRSPPVPLLLHKMSARDDYPETYPTTRLDRAGSADVLNKLEVIRKQLQSERQRVENQLEKDKFDVQVFDPRLVKAAPIPAIPVVMSPPLLLSPVPRRSPDIDIFETALQKAPAPVKRAPVDPVNADILNEFNQYKNRNTDSRQKFRQLFPDQPTTSGALEAQQLALLRHQEDQLNQIRQDPPPNNMGSRTMLKSESAYIDPDGIPVKPDTARERRRKKKVQVESPKSSRHPSQSEIGSTTSLNSNINKKNESRLKKLKSLNDDDSLHDPDDVLDRFLSRQQHNRPTSGLTGDSEVLSELLYSAASLLQLANDAIIKHARNMIPTVNISVEKLKSVLTAVEYVEVLVELTAQRYGAHVKWAIVSVIEIFRICLRLILLVKYKTGIQPCPPLLPLQRTQAAEQDASFFGEMTSSAEEIVTLKRSGRRLRTLNSSPPAGLRSWELPKSKNTSIPGSPENGETSSTLCFQRRVAEGLHILRPAVHLLSMYKYGVKSWKPWFLACGVDLSSILLTNSTEGMTAAEQSEMRRRTNKDNTVSKLAGGHHTWVEFIDQTIIELYTGVAESIFLHLGAVIEQQ